MVAALYVQLLRVQSIQSFLLQNTAAGQTSKDELWILQQRKGKKIILWLLIADIQ